MRKSLRELGLNPKALGTNPRAQPGYKRQRRRKASVLCGKGQPVVYLVSDELRGWSKVGATSNLVRRMSTYRANGDTHRVLYESWPTSSIEDALRMEASIIAELATRFPRGAGDWFVCTAEEAFRVVIQ